MRQPRFILRNATVEITLRTTRGLELIHPSAELTRQIWAVLGRAIRLTGVEVHAFVFLSNHYHLILTVRDAQQLAAFECHLNKNIGDAIRRTTGWQGPVWDGRYRVATILDEQKQAERLYYVCANSVKEGLVERPTDWPGVSAARALLSQEPVETTWQPRRRGAKPQANVVVLAPLPFLAHMSTDQRRSYFQRLFEDIRAAGVDARHGRPVAGVEKLLRDRRLRPRVLERTAGPRCHGSPENRQAFEALHRAFISEYRAASRRLSAGELDVSFPFGAFRPGGAFVPWPGSSPQT